MVVGRFQDQRLLVFFVGRKDGGGIRSRPLRAVAALKVSDPLSDEKRVFLKNRNILANLSGVLKRYNKLTLSKTLANLAKFNHSIQ